MTHNVKITDDELAVLIETQSLNARDAFEKYGVGSYRYYRIKETTVLTTEKKNELRLTRRQFLDALDVGMVCVEKEIAKMRGKNEKKKYYLKSCKTQLLLMHTVILLAKKKAIFAIKDE